MSRPPAGRARPTPAPSTQAPPPPASPARRGGLAELIETANQESLVVTHWFEPDPTDAPYSVTIRFSGRRRGVAGKPQPGDAFVHDETVEVAAPGTGPISVTARVRDVTPGEWEVQAAMASPPRVERRRRGARPGPTPRSVPVHPAAWSLLHWRLSTSPRLTVHTGIAAFAPVPGLIPGAWLTLTVLGIVLGITIDTLLNRRLGVSPGPALLVAVLAIATGCVGAKIWFLVKHRRRRLTNGWCIQGLLVGTVPVLLLGAVAAHLRLGTYLDAAAAPVLLGMAVGRLGCFFAGCCYGRPTDHALGVWCSDQRIGTRRIPTQLIESAWAASLGLASMAVLLVHGPLGGALLLGTLSLYTLVRQGILQLRGERPGRGSLATAIVTGLLVVGAAVAVLLSGGRGWL